MKKTFAWALAVVALIGCDSVKENATVLLEPLPTTLLPVSAYRAALTAAEEGGGGGGVSEYRQLAKAAYIRSMDENSFSLEYNYYFKPLQNAAAPVGLHDYLQHPDNARAVLAFGAGGARGTIGGRYNVIHAVPLEPSLSFSRDYFDFTLRGSYYIKSELDIGAQIMFGEENNAGFTKGYIFGCCAWKLVNESALFLEGGFRINDTAADGVFIKSEYYFDRLISAGITFSTDVAEEIYATGSYRFANGLGANLEIGSKYDKFWMLLGAEYRF